MKKFTVQAESVGVGQSRDARVQSSGWIAAEGRVVAYPGAEVTVGTEVVGTIINVPAQENAVVRKGDLLVELRADDVKASLREGHFRLIEAETGLRLLRARFPARRQQIASSPRLRNGWQRPALSAPGNRADAAGAAAARRDAAKATVERLEASRSRQVPNSRAQSRGGGEAWVIFRHVDPGETVTPGNPLVTIVDLSRLRIEAEVDEFDIAGIAVAAKATIMAVEWIFRAPVGGPSGRSSSGGGEPPNPSRRSRPAHRHAGSARKGDAMAFREPNPLKLGRAALKSRLSEGTGNRDSPTRSLLRFGRNRTFKGGHDKACHSCPSDIYFAEGG